MKIRNILWILLFAGLWLPLHMHAQRYETLWKSVEELEKKDLPKSVMEKVDDIYRKASAERNLPQMMKAFLVRSEYQVRLVPDSVETEIMRLEAWAQEETDTLGKAVLDNLLGYSLLQQTDPDVEKAVASFRNSLQHKDFLENISAKDFRPMTVSGKLSETYFGDNMYDLLARNAITGLRSYRWDMDKKVGKECMRLYDELVGLYENSGNRASAMLCKEARLMFRYDNMWNDSEYRLPVDAYLEELEKLAVEYKDLPVASDLYVKMALACLDKGDKVQAMQLVREGLEKYPKGEGTETLKGLVKNITQPYLQVNVPFIYPDYMTGIQVKYANLKGVTFEFYRLNLPVWASALNRSDEKDLLKEYGKKVSTCTFNLQETVDYRNRDTVLQCRLPAAGIYVMKQIPLGNPSCAAYSKLYVTPYQLINLPFDTARRELVAVDKLTGHPVAGAEIVAYSRTGNDYVLKQVYKAGSDGSVKCPVAAGRDCWFNVRTPGNDFMALGYYSYGNAGWVYDGKQKEEKSWSYSEIFTDRAIYRPGQTVYVSAVQYEQKGDSLGVLKRKNTILKLYSLRQDIAEQHVVTDDFGVVSGTFVLPSTLLPGTYYVSTDGGSASFQVAEYKRPTFDVTFDTYQGSYKMGDTVYVKGCAMTFAGAPVRMADVKYKVIRKEMRRIFYSTSSVELASGEVQTDTDGKFSLEAVLEKPENWTGDEEAEIPAEWIRDTYTYYVYEVVAEVTDGAHETRQAEITFPVSKQSLMLGIKGLDAIVMKEKLGKIQFTVMNLQNSPVKAEVDYKVYVLEAENKKGELKLEGKAVAQQSFVPDSFRSLPSGRYVIEVETLDEQGRKCTVAQRFDCFSAADAVPPAGDVSWFYQDGNVLKPDEAVTLYVGSAEKDVYMLVDVYCKDRRISSDRLVFSNALKKFEYTYKKEYGEGIMVCFTFMRKGSLYTKSVRLEYQKPDKRLDVKWETFRDKLQTGAQEEWCLHITGKSGKPANANLMAVLYDASLDKLQKHGWGFSIHFPRRVPTVNISMMGWEQQVWMYSQFPWNSTSSGLDLLNGDYSRLYRPNYSRYRYVTGSTRMVMAKAANTAPLALMATGAVDNRAELEVAQEKTASGGFNVEQGLAQAEEVLQITDNAAVVEAGGKPMPAMELRENFAETAFFYPALRTDSLGNVKIVFTVPDALTEWKFYGFAHTQQVDYCTFSATAQAEKLFMVQPNLPRFVRKGDKVVITSSLINMAMEAVSGTAHLQLLDPVSGKEVCHDSRKFTVGEGETQALSFSCEIPDKYDILVCKVMADAGTYSDGEQHYLPVLTDKQWITETVPVQLDGDSQTVVETEDLFNGQSKTATGRRLTVELTGNPDWYAVQALTAVSNPENEDALSWATAYYANALATEIVNRNPRIKDVFRQWIQAGNDKQTLLSSLEKNRELKNILLEETPWLKEASDESERKRRIALLFDLNTMSGQQQTAVRKLQELQLDGGAWSWYKGMYANRYVTTQIVEMMARLKAMGVKLDVQIEKMYRKASDYLKTEVGKEYDNMREMERKTAGTLSPSNQAIHYLYVCALDADIAAQADQTVNTYMVSRLEDRSASYTIYEKALIAVIMQQQGKKRQAAEWVQSVKEYAVATPGMGRYYDTPKAFYSWNSYRIPTQVAAMEAIHRIAPDTLCLNEMKQWLLKQKQVQSWSTPVATADAVYAFLYLSGNKLETNGHMKAVVGTEILDTPDDILGYAAKSYTGTETAASSVRIMKTGTGIGWGAVYAQCLEEMDKVRDAEGNGLSITREYLMDGKKIGRKTTLRAGDRLTVRLTVKADRDMDFVQIKDERAACMEPEEQVSGYCWNGSIGAYRVIRDASVEFFVDKFCKGTYIFEYIVRLDRIGTYQTGIATIQSAYAPEFGGHTGGGLLNVSE